MGAYRTSCWQTWHPGRHLEEVHSNRFHLNVESNCKYNKDMLMFPGENNIPSTHLRTFRKVISQLGSQDRLAFNQDSVMKLAEGTLFLIDQTHMQVFEQ